MDPPLQLRELYAASYGRLVGVLTLATGRRDDAEEIVQDAFMRLIPRWEQVSRFDDPESWLRKVAFRLVVDRHRRSWRAVSAVVSDHESVDKDVDANIDIERAMARLPVAHRQVVLLHYLYDLPIDEIARVLNTRTGTVKSRLGRARVALGKMLDEEVVRDA